MSDYNLNLKYRAGGQITSDEFYGIVSVLGAERTLDSCTFLGQEELTLTGDKVLDLTKMPVVNIRAKKGKWRSAKAQEFLTKNPSFQGALYLWPFSWANGFGEGWLIVTSHDLLHGKTRASGGKPVVEWVNARWDDNGNLLKDKARTLHGKVKEVIKADVVRTPGPELIAVELVPFSEKTQEVGGSLRHPLRELCSAVCSELHTLHELSVRMDSEKLKWFYNEVCETLLQKLKDANVQKVSDIPADMTITAEEVAPELWAQRETVGKVEIPGLGVKKLDGWAYNTFHGAPFVKLTVAEIRQITAWPHKDLLIEIPEVLYASDFHSSHVYKRDAFLSDEEGDRWGKIKAALVEIWDEKFKVGIPEPKDLLHPSKQDLPATPEPLAYGEELLTGDPKLVYPAISHNVYSCRGRITDHGWKLEYSNDPKEAAEVDKKARKDAETYYYTRALQAKLASEEVYEEEVLRDFGGHFRRMGAANNADFWVIQPDGKLRDADCIGYRKGYFQEGNKHWSLVGPEEIALSWSKSCSKDEGEFEVVEWPAEEFPVTQGQKDAASKLEKELVGEDSDLGWYLDDEE